MILPQEFSTYTSALFGKDRWQRYLQAFKQMPATSIRLNPWKLPSEPVFEQMTPVPWCRGAYWLNNRPNFTFVPCRRLLCARSRLFVFRPSIAPICYLPCLGIRFMCGSRWEIYFNARCFASRLRISLQRTGPPPR